MWTVSIYGSKGCLADGAGAHEHTKCEGASYFAYAGGTSFQPSSNSDKVLLLNALLGHGRSVIHTQSWPLAMANFACVQRNAHTVEVIQNLDMDINLAEMMFYAVRRSFSPPSADHALLVSVKLEGAIV